MTKCDEYIPEQELREAIFSDVVLPRIEKLSKEAECSNSYRTVIHAQGVDIEDQENTGFWQIRLIVKHTFKSERKVWRVQAVMSRKHKRDFLVFK